MFRGRGMVGEWDDWGRGIFVGRDGWGRGKVRGEGHEGWVVVRGRRIVGKRDGSMFNLRDSKPNEVVRQLRSATELISQPKVW